MLIWLSPDIFMYIFVGLSMKFFICTLQVKFSETTIDSCSPRIFSHVYRKQTNLKKHLIL